MRGKNVAIIVGVVVLLLGAMVYSTLSLRRHRVEVCMEFHGDSRCATASGETREQAQRTATDTACATIASGMTDSIACTASMPKSVRWLE